METAPTFSIKPFDVSVCLYLFDYPRLRLNEQHQSGKFGFSNNSPSRVFRPPEAELRKAPIDLRGSVFPSRLPW